MHLVNDSPSFTPVHSQIRAIGPKDLHLGKGRGPGVSLPLKCFLRISEAIKQQRHQAGMGPFSHHLHQ